MTLVLVDLHIPSGNGELLECFNAYPSFKWSWTGITKWGICCQGPDVRFRTLTIFRSKAGFPSTFSTSDCSHGLCPWYAWWGDSYGLGSSSLGGLGV